MMDAKKTFKQLGKIYERRSRIEAARKAMLDQKVDEHTQAIVGLEQQRVTTDKVHEADLDTMLRTATKAVHFNTMLSALAVKKLQQRETVALLRYDTLRKREAREAAQEEADSQREVTKDAASRTEKMKILLEAEIVAEEASRELVEEEETVEAQACRQVTHA
jgi:hypothetical protein